MTDNPVRPNLALELALQAAGVRSVAGIDEAGRGALAGPVVAAAVILPLDLPGLRQSLESVHDSKQLSPRGRQQAYEATLRLPVIYATGSSSSQEIDTCGLIAATRLSMHRALAGLSVDPQHIILDYMLLPEDERPQTSLVRADSKSLSVAAASIVAKVTRDRRMIEWDRDLPGYSFNRHKGYGTLEHRRLLNRLGPSPIHRHSYAPVAAAASH